MKFSRLMCVLDVRLALLLILGCGVIPSLDAKPRYIYNPETGRNEYVEDDSSPAAMIKARAAERKEIKELRRDTALEIAELSQVLGYLGTDAAPVENAQAVLASVGAAAANENVYKAELRSWAQGVTGDFAAARNEKRASLAKQLTSLRTSYNDLDNYNSLSNVMLRTFVPELGGSTGSGWDKAFLMIFAPIARAFHTSLNTELEKVSGGIIKRLFNQFRGIAVSLGWASPLPPQKVIAWGDFVKKYADTMKQLSNNATAEQAAGDALFMRDQNRPKKQLPALIAAKPAQDADASAVVSGEEVQKEEVSAPVEAKKPAPMYVRVSDTFVKQMRGQISAALGEMGGSDNYQEQREVLCDMMNMLRDIDELVDSAHTEYHQPVLTPGVNNDVAACCSSLSSLIDLLDSMVAVERTQETAKSSDPYGAKGYGRMR